MRPRPTLELGLPAGGRVASGWRPSARPSLLRPWGRGWGGARGPRVSARQRPGAVLLRPALLPARSPHSFVLARGSWRCGGPAAPPIRRGAGPGEARLWGRGGAGRAGALGVQCAVGWRGGESPEESRGGGRQGPGEAPGPGAPGRGPPPAFCTPSTADTFVPGGFIVFPSHALCIRKM